MAKLTQRKIINSAREVKLLVVEDNIITQYAIQQMLNQLGYSADFAADGKTALAFYGPNYAFILMDIELPDFTGIEVAKAIRKVEEKQHVAHVPIIAITSHYDEPEYQESCMQAGMDRCSSKPDLMQLKAWISEYVTC